MSDLKLNLTDKERLLLANQYQILAHLEGDIAYSRLSEQLRDGHSYLYGPDLGIHKSMSEQDQNFVIDVLQLYSSLTKSYEEIADQFESAPYTVKFKGFDGNNEGDFYHFTCALHAADRFTDIITQQGMNSHMPCVPTYRAMLVKWKELGKPTYPMDKQTILAITRAHE